MIEHYDYMLNNYDKYGLNVSRDEFIELLNILEINDENLDSFHDVAFNGLTMFCDIFGRWDTDNELLETLKAFHVFVKRGELKEYLEMYLNETILYDSDSIEDVKQSFEWFIDEFNDSTDGYVRKLYY